MKIDSFDLPELNIRIRQIDKHDSGIIYSLRSNPEVNKYLARKTIECLKEAAEFIDKILSGIEIGKWFYWIVEYDQTPVGTVCLWNFNKENNSAEIGFELLPEYQKKGISFNSAREVIRFGFEKLGMEKIFGETTPDNHTSIGLLKKLNFELCSNSNSPGTILFVLEKPIS